MRIIWLLWENDHIEVFFGRGGNSYITSTLRFSLLGSYQFWIDIGMNIRLRLYKCKIHHCDKKVISFYTVITFYKSHKDFTPVFVCKIYVWILLSFSLIIHLSKPRDKTTSKSLVLQYRVREECWVFRRPLVFQKAGVSIYFLFSFLYPMTPHISLTF